MSKQINLPEYIGCPVLFRDQEKDGLESPAEFEEGTIFAAYLDHGVPTFWIQNWEGRLIGMIHSGVRMMTAHNLKMTKA